MHDLIAESNNNFNLNNLNKILPLVDDIVSKNYIAKLDKLDIMPLPFDDKDAARALGDVRLFKINEIVYSTEAEHNKTEHSNKLAAAFNSLSAIDCSIFLIIKGLGYKTEFYLGVRSNDSEYTTGSVKATLMRAVQGQFPGIKLYDRIRNPEIYKIIDGIETGGVCAVSCAANKSAENLNLNNFNSLEKFVNAMQGKKYTAIILANNKTGEPVAKLRRDYENIYTQLSSFASRQFSFASNKSINISESATHTETKGSSTNHSVTDTVGHSKSSSEGRSNSTSRKDLLGNLLTIGGAAVGTVAAIAFPPAAAVGLTIAGASGIGGFLGSSLGATKTQGTSSSSSESENYSQAVGDSYGENQSSSDASSKTQGETSGTSQTVTITQNNKNIAGMLERIDRQLKRLKEFESLGMWECAAYFTAENIYTAEIAAAVYKSLMTGENTGIETCAINAWSSDNKNSREVIKYVKNFIHPVFKYNNLNINTGVFVSSGELALHMGLPKKSVPGLPVIEHAEFAPEVVRENLNLDLDLNINLGKAYNMGEVVNNSEINLDKDSLAMHALITGSTGSGKSNAIYNIINELNKLKVKFMVIEPAKGEYKNIFAGNKDVKVYGTNPYQAELLRINPFKFNKNIHVLEHIDRLLDVFNVCWPMYAAMPAVLKSAVINAYEKCGWDMFKSVNKNNNNLFPTFNDVLIELDSVISSSAYSADTKGDYTGALTTRISSLTNGLNGQIFNINNLNELEDNKLFDENVIIDLSRVGSVETRALIMGVLLIKLNEYRLSLNNNINAKLNHVTVLEEAHNLLKRVNTEQSMDSANIAGKSVEMLANLIAEMRTYGEGFIIADQSPNALDASAIRNTNTKIILRLPDEADRKISGKAAALNDAQVDEIAKLPTGVAVVYQNDWLAPVLCRINKFEFDENIKYSYTAEPDNLNNLNNIKPEVMNLLLKHDISGLEIGRERLAKVINGLLKVDKLENLISQNLSPEQAHELLMAEINKLEPDMPALLKLDTAQLMLSEYVKLNNKPDEAEKRLNLYEKWRNYVKNIF